jgi:hypothetical protein
MSVKPSMNVIDLIALAREDRHTTISDGVLRRLDSFRRAFDAQRRSGAGSLNIFTFHAECHPECAVIDVVDSKRDNSKIDYMLMQQHLIWSAYEYCIDPCIYVVSENARCVESRGAPVRVALDIDARRLMFERVLAMCAYVHSKAFIRNTAFLDTDAFANAPLERVFERGFDVGLTYRHGENLMPLNEGVIFASARNVESVRRFFLKYLATFERLESNEHVRRYYGSIAAWRGGQLSLNVVGLPREWAGRETTTMEGSVRIDLLPCAVFNYSPDNEADLPPDLPALLNGKVVVHIKGQNKRHFHALRRHALCEHSPTQELDSAGCTS